MFQNYLSCIFQPNLLIFGKIGSMVLTLNQVSVFKL